MARGFLYNNKDYTFPKGKLIESTEEFDAMLASGEWLESRGVPSGVPLETEETEETGEGEKKEGGEEEDQPAESPEKPLELADYMAMGKDELLESASLLPGIELDGRKSLENLQEDVRAYLESKDGE